MINKLMLDSSILVEYEKKRRTELLDYLISQTNLTLYINSIVLSEYTFHWLADKGKVSPRSLQQSKRVSELITPSVISEPLRALTVLPSDDRIVTLCLDLMPHCDGTARPVTAQRRAYHRDGQTASYPGRSQRRRGFWSCLCGRTAPARTSDCRSGLSRANQLFGLPLRSLHRVDSGF